MTLLRPYGDTTGDGMVQVSFTLPMPHSKVAEGAAAQLANKMGLDPALVVHAKPMGRTSRSSSSTAGCTTSSTPTPCTSSNATTRCSAPRRSTPP